MGWTDGRQRASRFWPVRVLAGCIKESSCPAASFGALTRPPPAGRRRIPRVMCGPRWPRWQSPRGDAQVACLRVVYHLNIGAIDDSRAAVATFRAPAWSGGVARAAAEEEEAMRWTAEPKLADSLCDPVVRALMEDDGADARKLRVTLSKVARRIRRERCCPTVTRPACSAASLLWARRLTLAAALLCSWAATAHAQAPQPAQPDGSVSTDGSEKGPWDITLGGGIGMKPTYEGAKDYKATPLPFITIRYEELLFLSGEGVGVNVLSLGHFRAGLTAGYEAGRAQNDDSHLHGLGHIDDSLIGGAFAAYALGSYEFTAQVRQALTATRNGLQASFGGTYGLRVDDRLHLRFGPSVTIADREYMQTWFGITPTQAVNSSTHLSAYAPSGGVKDVAFRLTSVYDITKHWKLDGVAEAKELVDDAGNSPIVQSKTQGLLGLGVAYHF